MIGFYHVSDDVEAKIREGPSGDIKSYLALLDRLKDASKFFKLNNPESMELAHINELLETGLDALVREFLQLLKKYSKPVHIATLRDIAACEDTEGEGEGWVVLCAEEGTRKKIVYMCAYAVTYIIFVYKVGNLY